MKHLSPVTFALLLLLSAGAPRTIAFDFGNITNAIKDLNVDKVVEIGKRLSVAMTEMPEAQEIQLGRELTAQLLGAMPLLDDQAIQRYVNKVGRWLAMQTERADLPWHFAVADTATVGAFAAPGGYVVVTAGLLMVVNDENELAGVLAHEISHVVERHHTKAIMKQARTALAADVASDLISEYVSDNPQVTGAFRDAGMQIYGRGLDREDELAADRAGVVVAARAGYDPAGLLLFLLTLDQIDADEPRLGLFLSTHPATRDRIDRLDVALTGLEDRYPGMLADANRFSAVQRDLVEPTD